MASKHRVEDKMMKTIDTCIRYSAILNVEAFDKIQKLEEGMDAMERRMVQKVTSTSVPCLVGN